MFTHMTLQVVWVRVCPTLLWAMVHVHLGALGRKRPLCASTPCYWQGVVFEKSYLVLLNLHFLIKRKAFLPPPPVLSLIPYFSSTFLLLTLLVNFYSSTWVKAPWNQEPWLFFTDFLSTKLNAGLIVSDKWKLLGDSSANSHRSINSAVTYWGSQDSGTQLPN